MISGVTREGADRPGNTLKGVTPEGKIFLWLHLQIVLLPRVCNRHNTNSSVLLNDLTGNKEGRKELRKVQGFNVQFKN